MRDFRFFTVLDDDRHNYLEIPLFIMKKVIGRSVTGYRRNKLK